MRRGTCVLLAGAGALLLLGVVSSFVPVSAKSEVIPGQYIVVFKEGADADAAEERLAGRIERQSYRNAIRGFAAKLSDAEVAALKNDVSVEYVVEDHEVTTADRFDPIRESSTSNGAGRSARLDYGTLTSAARRDGSLSAQAVQSIPTGVNRINAENKTNTGAGVDVAVIDSGILFTHPDLAPAVVGGINCSTGAKTNYKDLNGHGTHVAGTIAAQNNTQGVVGVAPGSKLWAVRVLDAFGNGSWSSVICGLDFVTSKAPKNGGPIKVANLSLGGGGTSDNNCGNSNNDPLHKAICRTRDAGVTIVAATGNAGANSSGFVPAAYDDAVIAVSALADSDGALGGVGASTGYGADDTFATFSNYGSSVDIGAPGVSILSTWLSNGYKAVSGTSMASPHAAGAAALYIATHPSALFAEVRGALISAGEPSGSGHTDPSGKHPEPVLRVDLF